MENKKYNLSLSIDEMNLVVAALAKLPYETVYALLGDVRNSVSAQIEAENAPVIGADTNAPKSQAVEEH